MTKAAYKNSVLGMIFSLPRLMSQKTIGLLLDSRGIKLDIYANDKAGSVSNCERRQKQGKNLPKRSRYYQGNIDLDQIYSEESHMNPVAVILKLPDFQYFVF